VLLRRGHRVAALGLVHEAPYEWNDTFDDVFGWDLQHTRRVIWQDDLKAWLDAIQMDKGNLFGTRTLIPTFTAVRDPRILQPIEPLFSKCEQRPLKEMPEPPPKPLAMEEVGQQLFSKGIPNEAVDKVLVAIQRQRRLAKWYQTHGPVSGRPTEHEVVAHMILPLLLALGWSEQLLAVEWHKIDLACFWETPTTKDRCVLVCEAKWFGHGLQNTLHQAIAYVDKLKLDKCHRVLLTDGARLSLYDEGPEHAWSDAPVGYLNVTKIRTNHIAPSGTNAINTMVALTPAGVTREMPKGS